MVFFVFIYLFLVYWQAPQKWKKSNRHFCFLPHISDNVGWYTGALWLTANTPFWSSSRTGTVLTDFNFQKLKAANTALNMAFSETLQIINHMRQLHCCAKEKANGECRSAACPSLDLFYLHKKRTQLIKDNFNSVPLSGRWLWKKKNAGVTKVPLAGGVCACFEKCE